MITIIVLKMEYFGFTVQQCIQKMKIGDSNQTAWLGTVLSGSAHFAHTCLS